MVTEEVGVRLATLLPWGKVDPGLRTPERRLDVSSVAADAALLERLGYGGLVVEETKDDPFTVLALALASHSPPPRCGCTSSR